MLADAEQPDYLTLEKRREYYTALLTYLDLTVQAVRQHANLLEDELYRIGFLQTIEEYLWGWKRRRQVKTSQEELRRLDEQATKIMFGTVEVVGGGVVSVVGVARPVPERLPSDFDDETL